MKALIFYQDSINLNLTHKVLGFLSMKAHKILTMKTDFSVFALVPIKHGFTCLNNFEQSNLIEKRKPKKI